MQAVATLNLYGSRVRHQRDMIFDCHTFKKQQTDHVVVELVRIIADVRFHIDLANGNAAKVNVRVLRTQARYAVSELLPLSLIHLIPLLFFIVLPRKVVVEVFDESLRNVFLADGVQRAEIVRCLLEPPLPAGAAKFQPRSPLSSI